jgi:hypothetical protein
MQTKDFLRKFGDDHIFFFRDHTDQLPKMADLKTKTDSALPTLKQYNLQGYSIFFMVNRSSTMTRSKDTVDSVVAVWLDDDGGAADMQKWPVQPHIIVQTSPNKRQLYWLIKDPESVDSEEWKRMMLGMAKKYNCDTSVTDLPRVLRVPGFDNTKYPEKPKVTAEWLGGVKYNWKVLLRSFPLANIDEVHSRELSDFEGVGAAITNILTGSDFHTSRRGIQMHLANYGVPVSTITNITSGL